MTFTRWTKKACVLYLKGYADISVEWADSLDGMPFLAHIGATDKHFDYLQDALDWCEETALQRDIITGPDPLPPGPPDGIEYLEDKGLRP